MTALADGRPMLGMRWWLGVPLCALLVFYAAEVLRPDLLLVGNITIDIVKNTTPTGGAVSYAAVLAKALRLRSCVVTVAGPDADLDVFAGAHLHLIPSNSTLTFEHTYSWLGHSRRLRVTANPNVTVTRAHVPLWCRRARIVLLGPLTQHDLDAGSFVAPPTGWLEALLAPLPATQLVGLMAQGYQRTLDGEGRVLPLAQPATQLLAGLGPGVSVFLSDVETDSWPDSAVERVAGASARLLITRGEHGADELLPSGGASRIPPTPVDLVADTNGAGDTFATAYMVALMRGHPSPGAAASWAASRAVMQPQACKPRCAPALVAAGWPPVSWGERAAIAARGLLASRGEALVPVLRLGWVRDAYTGLVQAQQHPQG